MALTAPRALPPPSPSLWLTWQPGRRARAAYQALWRMDQSCSRSSSPSAQARPEPPFCRMISPDGDQELWDRTYSAPRHPALTQDLQYPSWALIPYPGILLVPLPLVLASLSTTL